MSKVPFYYLTFQGVHMDIPIKESIFYKLMNLYIQMQTKVDGETLSFPTEMDESFFAHASDLLSAEEKKHFLAECDRINIVTATFEELVYEKEAFSIKLRFNAFLRRLYTGLYLLSVEGTIRVTRFD